MNKKVIGFLLAVPALMGLGLTSCSDESSIADKVTAQEKLVNVTLTAQISNQTRASFEPDKAVLKFSWELEDEIQVVNAANGKYLGKLTVSEVKKDPRVCSFKGSLAIPTGKVKLNFFYLGKEGKASFGDGLTLNDFPVDFSTQNGEAHFEKNDILISTGEFENVENGNLGMINFDRDFAYGRFILKYNGEEVDLNGKSVTISANTGTLYNKASLNFQKAEYTFEEGNITVAPSTNDFYVSFFPTEAVNLKFVIEDFDGTKGNNLLANTYYTANTDGDPIVVEMRHSDGADDEQAFKLIYDPNYTSTSDDNKVYTKNRVGSADFTVQAYDLFAREGYEIVGWNTEADGSGVAYEAGETITITFPDLEQTLYAQWVKTTYNYTLVHEDNDGNEIIKEEFESDGDLTVTTKKDDAIQTAPEGYEFAGWALKENPTVPVETVTFTKDNTYIVVVPVWKEKEYTWKVQWVDDPAVGEEVYKTKLESGTSPHQLLNVHPANPTKDGYKFLGWEYEGKMLKSEKEVVMTKDNLNPKIYAKWEKIEDPNTVTTPGYGHGTFN